MVTSDVKQEVFEMKCMFEMKREGPRRKIRDCKRMSASEFRKKGCKNQTNPGSINESNHVQKAADCRKIIRE